MSYTGQSRFPRTVIVIPTYNERENIALMIPAVVELFRQLPYDMRILVVDDNSPDGTADVVRKLQSRYQNVDLLLGKKAGLGTAYIRGMRYALDSLNADIVFEMDADFSHKVEDIPRLLVNLEYGADFVIGSRYVPGGTIPREWNWLRKANSTFGNIVARHIAGLYRIRDCTAGFRAIRGSVLRRINLEGLRVQGYAFQVALLHAAVVQGAKVVEVPVDFVDRSYGTSKLGLRDIVEFIVNAWWIRFQASKTFIKFAMVGASGVAVNLAVFTALLAAGMNKYLASPIAIEASIITNFIVNNHWTFRWRKNRDPVRIKGLKYNIVSFIALGVSYSTFTVLSILLPKVAPQIHQAIGIVPATLVNYFLNSYWTFGNTGPTSAISGSRTWTLAASEQSVEPMSGESSVNEPLDQED